MTELCKLAEQYQTDKYIKHDYTPYYFDLFNPIRDKVKKVVEIGVGFNLDSPRKLKAGASLRMWRDFFPNAQIYGIDKKEICIKQAEDIGDLDRIQMFLGDAHKLGTWEKIFSEIGTDIDIIIDDGAHYPPGCRRTANIIMSLVKNPIYIIEDFFQMEELEKFIYPYEVIEVKKKDYKTRRNDNYLVKLKSDAK